MDVTVLHWGFIPDDQISLADEICQFRVLLDTIGRGFMDLDRDLEGGVNCAASFEKKRGNARGCNTNDNLDLTTKRGTESVVYESLACATWTMKKEALARLCLYSLHNEIKGRSLVMVEKRDPLLCQMSLLLSIIVLLPGDQRIQNCYSPLLLDLWHVWPEGQRLVMLGKKSADKEKAIVPNILIRGILSNVSALKGTPEIITEAVLMVIPKLSWTCWRAVDKDGNEKNPELMSSGH